MQRMRVSRLPFAILLAILLAFAQQAGATHALSHFSDDHQKEHSLAAKACEQCVAFASLGAAAPADTPLPHDLQLTHQLACVVLKGVARSAFTPYQSRAPPLLP
jgi:hypothetical protein